MLPGILLDGVSLITPYPRGSVVSARVWPEKVLLLELTFLKYVHLECKLTLKVG